MSSTPSPHKLQLDPLPSCLTPSVTYLGTSSAGPAPYSLALPLSHSLLLAPQACAVLPDSGACACSWLCVGPPPRTLRWLPHPSGHLIRESSECLVFAIAIPTGSFMHVTHSWFYIYLLVYSSSVFPTISFSRAGTMSFSFTTYP